MAIDGTRGSMSYNEERARGAGHHPVLASLPVKADNGDLPVGLLVEEDINGDLVAMTAIANVIGVLDEDIDTTKTGSALVVVHGSVRLPVLKTNITGTAPTADEVKALRVLGVFAE